MWLIYSKADIFILSRMFDSTIVGVYSVGQELSSLPLDRIGQIVNQVVFSGFSKIQNDKATIERYFIFGIRLASLLFFPIFLGISAVATPLIALVLGSNWAGAAIVVQILALIVPLRLVSTLCAETLNATGKGVATLRNVATTAVCVVGGMLVGVQFGVTGLCVGWCSGFTVAFFLLVYRFCKITEIHLSAMAIAMGRPLIACAGMYVPAFYIAEGYLGQSVVLNLLGAVLVGALSYTIFCVLFCKDYWPDIVTVVKLARGRN
jgi:O-antigen/teichoic acid export membrane protein